MFVSDLINLFRTKMISGVPVVDTGNTISGVVSLRDIAFNTGSGRGAGEIGYVVQGEMASLTAEEWQGIHLEADSDLKVSEIMTPLVFTVEVDTPIPEIADTLLKGRIHRLLVMDGERLAGMVTTMDLLKTLRDRSGG